MASVFSLKSQALLYSSSHLRGHIAESFTNRLVLLRTFMAFPRFSMYFDFRFRSLVWSTEACSGDPACFSGIWYVTYFCILVEPSIVEKDGFNYFVRLKLTFSYQTMHNATRRPTDAIFLLLSIWIILPLSFRGRSWCIKMSYHVLRTYFLGSSDGAVFKPHVVTICVLLDFLIF